MADDKIHEMSPGMQSSSKAPERKHEKPEQWPFHSMSIALAVVLLLTSIVAARPQIWETPINYYNRWRYVPLEVLDHYIKNPLGDVSVHIPVYYDSDMKFPDLPEVVDIQVNSRMIHDFYTLLNYTIDLIPGSKIAYSQGIYSDEDMFINLVLSDVNAIQVDGARNYGELYFNLDGVDSNDLPFFLTQLLVDHCFSNEINKYSPDSFYKVSIPNATGGPSGSGGVDEAYFLQHSDYMNHRVIRQLVEKATDEPIAVNIHVYVVGADVFDMSLQDTFDQSILPLFAQFPDYFSLNISVIDLTLRDPETYQEQSYVDDVFPEELSDLPLLKEIYLSTLDTDDDSGAVRVNFVFYPYLQGGDRIKEKTIENTPLYSQHENTYLKIGDWGSLYFAHFPVEEDVVQAISIDQLQDCVWSFNEALLDILGFPNDVLAPSLRVNTFRRYMVVQNIVHYSTLLKDADLLLQHKLATTSACYLRTLIQNLITTLEIRAEVVRLLEAGDVYNALRRSKKMVQQLKSIL